MDRDTDRERLLSRRKVLQSSATGAVIGGTALAGCMGDENGDENGNGNGGNGNGNGENGDGENGNGNGGNGNGENGDENGNGNGEEEDEWIQIFNGEDIDDWTPKFMGYEPGENLNNTFRVEDGLLTNRYDEWEEDYNGRHGHLFYEEEFSHYILHAEYRFVGEQIESYSHQDWAVRNNGLMLHGQTPDTMGTDQAFPRSLEFQLLGGEEGTDEDRPTGQLCTPGTYAVDMDGNAHPDAHCWADEGVQEVDGGTYYGDEWVHVFAVVRGSENLRHITADDGVIFEYREPTINPDEPEADADEELLIEEGTISIQSESAPTQFRTLEVLELDPEREVTPGEVPEEVQNRLE